MLRITRTPRIIQRLFPGMTWGFSLDESSIYLTFDDGPHPELTPWVLDVLKEMNAKATFFCVGEQVSKHPEIFERILKEGHAVGNHTMNHENGLRTDSFRYLKSIDEAAGYIPSKLFRPPYGRMKRSQIRALLARDYKIIMWTWLTYDFDKSYSTEEIRNESNRLRSGDIVVLHDNPKCAERLKEILPHIIQVASDKGLDMKAIN